jgi:enoyl-CoA hydratase/carnithine racemase
MPTPTAGGDTLLGTRVLLALGLVNAVVPPDEVLPTALGFAERIAANGPLGVAATKELGFLFGTTVPLTAEQLEALYGSHGGFVGA